MHWHSEPLFFFLKIQKNSPPRLLGAPSETCKSERGQGPARAARHDVEKIGQLSIVVHFSWSTGHVIRGKEKWFTALRCFSQSFCSYV